MVRHRIRESIKSFFGSHIDPEKVDQLKEAKTEIDEKVKKILKLVMEHDLEEKDGISAENSKKEPLAGLIQDFHKHYQELYERYDHLTGELTKKYPVKQGTETSSSSSSDSEPDNSLKEKGSKNGKLKSQYQKMTEDVKQELVMANLEIEGLKSKLATTTEEKEALNVEHQTALSRIQEAEEVIRNLKFEAEKLHADKAKLLAENGELKQRLDASGNKEAELNQRLEEMSREKDNLAVEKEIAIRKIQEGEKVAENLQITANKLQEEKVALGQELERLRVEVVNVKNQLESAELQVSDLSQNLNRTEEENKSLTSTISLLNQRLEVLNSEKDHLHMEKETAARKIEEVEKTAEDLRNLADQLQNEKATLRQELETLREQISSTKQQLESAEQKVSDAASSLKAADGENASLTLKLSDISSEIQRAQNTIQELTTESVQLNEKLYDKEREFSFLSEMHETDGNKSSTQIRELEAQVTGLELELESLRALNRDMEVHIENRVSEAKQLGEENLRLEDRISELEMMSKERGDELSSLTKKLEDNEKETLSRVESLMAQINSLLTDLESLRGQKAELEEQIVRKGDEASVQVKYLMDHVNELQIQLEYLHSEKAELEMQLQKKTQDISEFLIQIETLKEEIACKTEDRQRILGEKESLTGQIDDLGLEMETLRNQKADLEEQIKTEIKKSGQLGEEMQGLQDQILELEKTTRERGLEFSALQERHEKGEDEASAKIITLTTQANNLQLELDSLQAEKNQLQLQLEKEKQEFLEGLTQMENEKTEFMSQIADQQKTLEEQEEAFRKLGEECKQVEGLFQECKGKLKAAERKVEEFQKIADAKDEMIAELEKAAEDLKRDLELKEDELNSTFSNVNTIEVKLRLSNQKLRVTEQLLHEKEESFKKAEISYQQEQRMLLERVATLSGIIAATKEACHKMVADFSETVTTTLNGAEALALRVEEDCSRYAQRVLEFSNEILIVKSQVIQMKNEKEQLGKEVGDLVVQLEDAKKREPALREKVEVLEVMVSKNGVEKQNLTKAINELQRKVMALETMVKEKDEGIVDLGEEKREAIRQLCMWIDYQRSRYDHLREMVSKMPVRGQRTA